MDVSWPALAVGVALLVVGVLLWVTAEKVADVIRSARSSAFGSGAAQGITPAGAKVAGTGAVVLGVVGIVFSFAR